MELVSGCDMPENDRFGLGADGDLQRMRELAQTAGEEDTTHLHKMGDFAVTLVRVPEFTLFVFSLPGMPTYTIFHIAFYFYKYSQLRRSAPPLLAPAPWRHYRYCV